MYAKRRDDIMAMLKERAHLSVREIAERLLVSEMTIRRDLSQMEKEGIVKRSFGGASLSDGFKMEQSVALRATQSTEAKHQIAEAAAALVPNGAAVALDVGTTVYELAKLLSSRAVTIHTSSLPTAICANGGVADVWVSGGRMEHSYEVLNGPSAENFYRNIYCDYASLKRIMLSRARTRVLLADASKFNEVQQFRSCGLENLDIVITDSQPDESYLKFFQEHQIRLLVADEGAGKSRASAEKNA